MSNNVNCFPNREAVSLNNLKYQQPPYQMNLLIIEDRPLLLTGLEMMIRQITPQAKIYTAATVLAGLDILNARDIKLMIFNNEVCGKASITRLKKIRRTYQEMAILLITECDEKIYAISYIKAGADGFLFRKATTEEFERAIKIVINGKKYVSSTIQQLILQRTVNNPFSGLSPIQSLSARQKQIMDLLIERKSHAEIGELLNIKEISVTGYMYRIYEKLGVKNLNDLIIKVEVLELENE